MPRRLIVGVAVVGVLALQTVRTPAQSSAEVAALRQEIERLKKEQQSLRGELEALRKLVAARPPATPAAAAATVPPAAAREIFIEIAGEPSRGNRNARVVLVEFSDYQCPFCQRYTRETLPQLEREYIDTGKVRYVFRDFPIESLHPQAFKAHQAANCAADQGKYWEMHARLFGNQQALAPPGLTANAKAMGLDVAAFQACLDSGRYAGEIRNDQVAGRRAGVTGTPTFFVGVIDANGTVRSKTTIVGSKPYAAFKAALDAAIAP